MSQSLYSHLSGLQEVAHRGKQPSPASHTGKARRSTDPEIGEVHRCMVSLDSAIANNRDHWDRTVYLEERDIGTRKSR